MKPVKQFVGQIENVVHLERTELFGMLRQAGYYEFHSGFDCHDIKLKEYLYDAGCELWCHTNYPNDYFSELGTFFFTNKEIATLMKLSVL
jgi:hypothetical protein